LSGGACQEKNISSFPGRGTQRLRLHFGIKSIVSLGVHVGKARREVSSLQFPKAIAIIKGIDFSKVQLFLCWNI
jgi:hypothetical protein